jgi:DNA-directed RNA polymerase
MRELWNAGGGVAGLPERELMDLPSRPALLETDPDYFKEHHADEFKEWKRDRAKVCEANRAACPPASPPRRRSPWRRSSPSTRDLLPHNLDFRGRCYPAPDADPAG